jgi:hypothetical protein
VHTSYIAAGLKSLEKDGKIRLTYKIGSGKAKGRNGLLFSQQIKIPSLNRTIVFDMHDQSDYFFPDYYEDKTIEYYKSNFNINEVEKTNRIVHPFVPYFPIKYPIIHWKQIIGFFCVVFGKNKSLETPILKNYIQSIFTTLRRIQRLKQRCKIEDFFTDTNKQTRILFNPGCWPEKDEYQLKANLERYQLIKALKFNFQNVFKGGFPDNKTASEKYYEAIAEKQNSHKDYLKNIQNAKINIYTNGLNNCISWRLGELISTGSFIVGPKLPYQFYDKLLLNNYISVERSETTEYITKCSELLNEKHVPSNLSAKQLNPKNILNQIIFNQ